jgi:hypothetical protein
MHAVNQRGSFGNNILLLKSVRFRVIFQPFEHVSEHFKKTLGKNVMQRPVF